MRNLGLLLIVVAISSLQQTKASDEIGYVCFGKNMAKPLSEHSELLTIQIGESQRFQFNDPTQPPSQRRPRRILEGLDVNERHIVRVFFDGKQFTSWWIDFTKLGSNGAIIWRGAGAWKMEPAIEPSCKIPSD